MKASKMLEHLPPGTVDRAVAFVGDDQIEALDWHCGIVAHDPLDVARAGLETGALLFLFGKLAAAQHRIDPLDRRYDDRGAGVKAGRPEPLDVVDLGKGPAGAGRSITLELLTRWRTRLARSARNRMRRKPAYASSR